MVSDFGRHINDKTHKWDKGATIGQWVVCNVSITIVINFYKTIYLINMHYFVEFGPHTIIRISLGTQYYNNC